VPIEIRRFGIGNRRPQGPPGSTGVTGQVIHSDAAGVVAELAFSRGGRIEPHANPNVCWFIVIEGGGWTQVGDERSRVAAGDAVAWPPDLPHGAWTETSEMRAFIVEFASDPIDAQRALEGRAASLPPASASAGPGEVGGTTPTEGATRAEGALRDDPGRAAASYDPDEGEPR
jgi:quercetin dioxygenase-like cupin family protein